MCCCPLPSSSARLPQSVSGTRWRPRRKKGMWMGGFVPLGYDAVDKKLVVNEREAKQIRILFDLYLKLGNVRLVKVEADKQGIVTKRRNARDERIRGGRPLSPRPYLRSPHQSALSRQDPLQGRDIRRRARCDHRPGNLGAGSGQADRQREKGAWPNRLKVPPASWPVCCSRRRVLPSRRPTP